MPTPPSRPHRRRRQLAGAVALLISACVIEDRTPTGTRRDEALLQRIVHTYHRSGTFPDGCAPPSFGGAVGLTPALRPVRFDIRQAGDLATVWVSARGDSPALSRERSELWVFRRRGTGWCAVRLDLAAPVPERP